MDSPSCGKSSNSAVDASACVLRLAKDQHSGSNFVSTQFPFPDISHLFSALGVGSKTLEHPAPLEMLDHDIPDLEVLSSAERAQLDNAANAMESADAQAYIRAAHVSPTSTRSTAALHSLMEQGL